MVDGDGVDLDKGTEAGLGASLKSLRIAAGLTQEELAEQAGVSARTVSDVERGLRDVVHLDTARRLASALRLQDEARRWFEALARGRSMGDVPRTKGGELPAVPTPLLGRSAELERITALLLTGGVRLLTLTGPGGIGKTRLAVEATQALAPSFPDGVFFVSLGEVMDASLVASELARTIGAVDTGLGFEQILAERLAGRRVLIVLDTFEHLMPAAPLVYSLFLACPETSFLVTSRSALRVRGEQEFPVPPLESPTGVPGGEPDDIMRWPATVLFWDRARAVRPDLPLDAESVSLVVEICRRLDGLPLAIELAAARVKHLPLAAIRGQLEHRLEFLVGGPLDLPLRQRAIRDTVAWSYGLLDGRAQLLFRRLSVFAGGWGLDDVPGVCGATTEIGDPLEGISALVDQSLVVVLRNSAEARYDMLDVIREYAARRLAQAGEDDEISRRHALHFLHLAEETEPRLVRTGHQRWFQRLDVERANLRAGMAWVIQQGETVLALRYMVALWRHWRHLGDFAEGRWWLDTALALPGPAPVSLRAKALWAAEALAFPQGDHERMTELAAEAYELAQQSEDRMDLRNALTGRGMAAMVRGRYTEALEPFRESVAICAQLGSSWQLGTSYLNLGTALLHAGFHDNAVATLQKGGRVYRQLGDEVFAARTDNTIAHAALARGDVDEADSLARTALRTASEQQERQGIGDGLHTLAAVAAARSDPDRAATLTGAAAAVRETIAARPGLFDLAIPGRFLEAIEGAVSAERWQRAWSAGYELDAEAAVAYALSS
jgi:predicted ATPase/transcriptional regulator with XRE-family HTH domain